MNNSLLSFFVVLILAGICNADEIFLIDGSSAKTKNDMHKVLSEYLQIKE